MYPFFLRLGAIAVGAVVAKFFLLRYASKGFDLQKTIEAIAADLHNVAKDVRDKGDTFATTLEELLDSFDVIKQGQYEDLDEIVAQSQRVLTLYHSLPQAAKLIMRTTIDLESRINDMLREASAVEGAKLLSERAPTDRSLRLHLQRQYRGLYYLGVAGEPLADVEIERISTTLAHFHQQLNRPTDHSLMAWYRTIGTDQEIPLPALLATCPEARSLNVDLNVIASLLDKSRERPEVDILKALSVNK